MLKRIPCPSCDLPYTDNAVQWAEGWIAGRVDLYVELQGAVQERDGPVKIRCELCEAKAWINYFSETAELVNSKAPAK